MTTGFIKDPSTLKSDNFDTICLIDLLSPLGLADVRRRLDWLSYELLIQWPFNGNVVLLYIEVSKFPWSIILLCSNIERTSILVFKKPPLVKQRELDGGIGTRDTQANLLSRCASNNLKYLRSIWYVEPIWPPTINMLGLSPAQQHDHNASRTKNNYTIFSKLLLSIDNM